MSNSVDSVSETRTLPVIQRISPRTIPGVLTNTNKGALDWGWQSFVAYGCHNHVVVVDTQNVKVFQTLEQHKGDVIKVKWAKESYYHDLSRPYSLKLASADTNGLIIVWDVKGAKPLSSFSEGYKPIQEIEWLSGKDSWENLLVALHPPYTIIVWDTSSGTKVWKKSYTETLISFAFDPFHVNRLTFLASDCILFVDDFSVSKVPSSNGRKFYIANSTSSSGTQQPNSTWAGGASGDDRSWPVTRNIIPKRMRFLVREDSKSSVEGVTLNDCLQLAYHRSYCDHLLLLYPREILVLDLEINQTVGIVSVDHNGSPITQMYSCWQRDAFFVLHENGCVNFRLRHRGYRVMAAATPSYSGDSLDSPSSPDSSLEVVYDQCCQSEPLRFTKYAKVFGLSVCPRTEKRVALLVSDGRMLFIDLIVNQKDKDSPSRWAPHLSEYLMNVNNSKNNSPSTPEKSTFPFVSKKAVHPGNALSDCVGPALYPSQEFCRNFKDSAKFRLFITGNLCALAAPPHVIRMCPPVTFRNWKIYQPLMAIGNGGGTIQVMNMATGVMTKEFCVHTSPVRGIEWIGLTSFMSFAHSNTLNNSGHVRNELVLTDIQSGRTKSLRADRQEESPIEMLRVSYLRQYVIIAFKEEPFELWDLRLLTLLRIMSKNFPTITALEWSPVHKKQQSTLDFSLDKLKENIMNSECSPETEKGTKALTYTKEHFVFTDTNGQLHHFSVEGNIVRDGSTIPADAGMGCITCIAWKGDSLVLGDVDGNLNVLDLKSRISRGVPTHRGGIKKVRFGPGKGNMKVIILTSDGVDLWDIKDIVRVQSVRCPRDIPKVQDVDWVGSDKPCVATADGSIRILDLDLKQTTSPVYEYQPSDIPFSPHLLSPEVAFYVKSYMQHLIMKQQFNADVDHQDNYSMCLAEKQLESLERDVKTFIAVCPFGTAERALHISRLFGDEEGCHFWTVALYFMKVAKLENVEEQEKQQDAGDCLQPQNKNSKLFFDQPLDTGYDVLCDNETYKKLQLDRVALHVHKRSTHSQTQKCAERLLLLGQTETAVTLLLETEATNENFYTDCLRACLTATVQSSGTSQSIIKLVSTNLIASGRVMEGVQLLCLIEKGMDACRYLLGAARWEEAVWLAKSTLPMSECQEILKRWVDHLSSSAVDQKNKALLVLMTMRKFWKAIQLMHSWKMTERAALFLEACLEFGLITRTEENSLEMDSIFLEYSEYLLSIKNRTSSIHYCALFSMSGDDCEVPDSLVNEKS